MSKSIPVLAAAAAFFLASAGAWADETVKEREEAQTPGRAPHDVKHDQPGTKDVKTEPAPDRPGRAPHETRAEEPHETGAEVVKRGGETADAPGRE